MKKVTISSLILMLGVLAMAAPKPDRPDKAEKLDHQHEKQTKKGAKAAPPTPEPVKETGFGAFRLVRLKNIFDPDRRPMPVEGKPTTAAVSTGGRQPSLILTGTMVTEERRLAFFNGSQPEYNRVLPAREHIADCELKTISTTSVELIREDKTIVLPVGRQLLLNDKNTITAAPVLLAPPPSALPPSGSFSAGLSAPGAYAPPSDPSASPAAGSAMEPAPVDRAELIRRMMERRLKETR